MAHAVDQAGVVKGLLMQQLFQVILHRVLVAVIGDMFLHIVEHFDDLNVGAAVLGSLQRSQGRRDGGISIGAGGGDHVGGKGRVVSAAVLRVEHQGKV